MNFKWHIITRLPIMLSSRLITLPKYKIKMYSGYSFFSTQPSFGQNNVIQDVQLRSINQVSATETDDVRRARLLYQSRKRGNLENGILLRYSDSIHIYISISFQFTHSLLLLLYKEFGYLKLGAKILVYQCFFLFFQTYFLIRS
ncbi:unnamed protein product [Schistosoma mattheei]|uniref:Uncharacterized protein n=1 Tax=Schistosoma mattheei TaxID=31246 RepID=A0A183ND96_9TREM|nr:unnamed protein product [Schistosoma mattheei]